MAGILVFMVAPPQQSLNHTTVICVPQKSLCYTFRRRGLRGFLLHAVLFKPTSIGPPNKTSICVDVFWGVPMHVPGKKTAVIGTPSFLSVKSSKRGVPMFFTTLLTLPVLGVIGRPPFLSAKSSKRGLPMFFTTFRRNAVRVRCEFGVIMT